MFGLNGQIEHKLAFLRERVPRETGLVLLGHSIGCYIILEMIKRNPELKVKVETFITHTQTSKSSLVHKSSGKKLNEENKFKKICRIKI